MGRTRQGVPFEQISISSTANDDDDSVYNILKDPFPLGLDLLERGAMMDDGDISGRESILVDILEGRRSSVIDPWETRSGRQACLM